MLAVFLLLVTLTTVLAQPGQHGHHGHVYTDATRFAHYLKEIEESGRFLQMSAEDKLLYTELVMAAEEGSDSLTHFLDRVGFLSVMRFVDHMNEDDITHFEAYLAAHMKPVSA